MFEWDESKRKQNIDKHGVDFIDAASIFKNPVIEDIDDRTDYGETRYTALGRIEDEYYTVIFTWRDRARRLISAWKVGESGKRRYQAIFSGRTHGVAQGR